MSVSGLKMVQLISASEAKKRFPKLIQQVNQDDRVVALTHHGIPSAILLSLDQYQGLIETAEILGDRKTMRSLRRSLRQSGKEEWVDHRATFGPSLDQREQS